MQFFGITLYNGTYADFLTQIFSVKKPTLVFTPNPEIFYRAYHDEEFMNILQKATYNVPDGNGLYVASMMQEGKGFFASGWHTFFDKKNTYAKYGELIKGSDLTRDIFESASKKPKNILVIDRKNSVAKNDLERRKIEMQQHLGEILEKKFPWTTVHVIFDGEMASDGIAHYIELQKIDFVLASIGMKRQEQRLEEVFVYLPEKFPVVGIGVGASIDFLLGLQKRAPRIFRDNGFEWLYRLITQPRIRARRVWTAVRFPGFVKRTMKGQ